MRKVIEIDVSKMSKKELCNTLDPTGHLYKNQRIVDILEYVVQIFVFVNLVMIFWILFNI